MKATLFLTCLATATTAINVNILPRQTQPGFSCTCPNGQLARDCKDANSCEDSVFFNGYNDQADCSCVGGTIFDGVINDFFGIDEDEANAETFSCTCPNGQLARDCQSPTSCQDSVFFNGYNDQADCECT